LDPLAKVIWDGGEAENHYKRVGKFVNTKL